MREADLHRQVCDYLKLQHPGAIFRTDFAAGMRMPIGMAMRQKSLHSGRAWPDIFIAEPRGLRHGLFLELKKEGTRVYLKDGSLSADKHIQEQAKMLKELRQRGFVASFAIGFSQAKEQIDTYLKDLSQGEKEAV